jgi:predicted site-specific integrase-resolvase
LATQEIAARLGKDVVTIRRWAARGEIPAGKLPNGEYIFDWHEVYASIFPQHSTAGDQADGGDK